MVALPPLLLEGSNAAVAFAIVFVLAVQLACLTTAFVAIGDLRSWYRQMKPVIALTVMAFGYQVRSAPIWWFRFADHHRLDPTFSMPVVAAAHVFGTCAALIGLLCWLRVTIPKFCGTRSWAAVVALTGLVFCSPWIADGAIFGWAWLLDAAPRFKIF